MKTLDSSAILRCAIREQVCTVCYQRPPHSESLPATEARSCEGACPVFRHLNTLRAMVESRLPESPGACERAMIENICRSCDASPTAGEFCAERLNRTCPLSRYMCHVMEIVERTLRHRQRPAA